MSVFIEYERQLVRARTLQVAGEFHAFGVYKESRWADYVYTANIGLLYSLMQGTAAIRKGYKL